MGGGSSAFETSEDPDTARPTLAEMRPRTGLNAHEKNVMHLIPVIGVTPCRRRRTSAQPRSWLGAGGRPGAGSAAASRRSCSTASPDDLGDDHRPSQRRVPVRAGAARSVVATANLAGLPRSAATWPTSVQPATSCGWRREAGTLAERSTGQWSGLAIVGPNGDDVLTLVPVASG